MKIGSVRRAPPASCRSTTGVLDWRSTRTAVSSISTMGATLPAEQCARVGIGAAAEGAQLAGHDPVEVAVALLEVEPVPQHELVGDLEAGEADPGGNDPANGLVEQRAD